MMKHFTHRNLIDAEFEAEQERRQHELDEARFMDAEREDQFVERILRERNGPAKPLSSSYRILEPFRGTENEFAHFFSPRLLDKLNAVIAAHEMEDDDDKKRD